MFVFDEQGEFAKAMCEVHNSGPAAKGHGISIRKDGGDEYLYLAPADSSKGFTKMTLSGEVVWVNDRATINYDSDGLPANPASLSRPMARPNGC